MIPPITSADMAGSLNITYRAKQYDHVDDFFDPSLDGILTVDDLCSGIKESNKNLAADFFEERLLSKNRTDTGSFLQVFFSECPQQGNLLKEALALSPDFSIDPAQHKITVTGYEYDIDDRLSQPCQSVYIDLAWSLYAAITFAQSLADDDTRKAPLISNLLTLKISYQTIPSLKYAYDERGSVAWNNSLVTTNYEYLYQENKMIVHVPGTPENCDFLMDEDLLSLPSGVSETFVTLPDSSLAFEYTAFILSTPDVPLSYKQNANRRGLDKFFLRGTAGEQQKYKTLAEDFMKSAVVSSKAKDRYLFTLAKFAASLTAQEEKNRVVEFLFSLATSSEILPLVSSIITQILISMHDWEGIENASPELGARQLSFAKTLLTCPRATREAREGLLTNASFWAVLPHQTDSFRAWVVENVFGNPLCSDEIKTFASHKMMDIQGNGSALRRVECAMMLLSDHTLALTSEAQCFLIEGIIRFGLESSDLSLANKTDDFLIKTFFRDALVTDQVIKHAVDCLYEARSHDTQITKSRSGEFLEKLSSSPLIPQRVKDKLQN